MEVVRFARKIPMRISHVCTKEIGKYNAHRQTRLKYPYCIESTIETKLLPEKMNLGNDKNKNRHKMALVDSRWGSLIVEEISKHVDLQNANSVILEINPGPGLLTTALLNSGITRHRTCIQDAESRPHFQKLQETFEGRLKLEQKVRMNDILNTLFLREAEKSLHNRADTIIVGVVPPRLISAYITTYLNNYDIPELAGTVTSSPHFLIVDGVEKLVLTDLDKKFWPRVITRLILYQLFFKSEVLCKVPIQAFGRSRFFSRWKDVNWDKENMYLVKLTPKSEVFKNFNTNQMSSFVQLIKLINKHPGLRLIPILERYCPDCGVILIDLGYSMMDEPKDVSPCDYTIILQTLLRFHGYQGSDLQGHLERHLEHAQIEAVG